MATSANADRRDPTAPRRAFQGTVDLSIPDENERISASGIDLSLGGMQLRSSVLPEVGEALGFRFQLEDGQEVATRGEVVWSDGEGSRKGAFGVRFLELTPAVRAAIAKATTRKDDRMVPPGSRIDDTRVKLFIDGMDAPFRAKIRTRTDGGMVLGSDLSFLRIGDKVNVEGAAQGAGYLDGVDVEIDPKTQVARLVLTIDTDMKSGPKSIAPKAAPAVVEVAEEKPVAKVEAKVSAPEVKATKSVHASVTAPAVADARKVEASAQATTALRSSDDEDDGYEDEDDDGDGEEAAPGWLTRGMAAVQGAYGKVRDAVGPAAEKARGALGSVRAKMNGEAPKADESTASSGPKLRPQHAPEAAPTKSSKKALVALPVTRNKRVITLAALATVLTVGIVAVAMSGGPSTHTPQPQVAVAPENALPAETPADPNAAANAGSVEAPETTGTEGAPTAFPEPRTLSANGGRLPADLQNAASSTAADVHNQPAVVGTRSVVRARPAAAPGLTLNAHPVAARTAPIAAARTVTAPANVPTLGSPTVRTGTVLRLRMDGPITVLQGPGANGASIVVRVPGRRSLDVAGPLSRQDPRLAGAGIMNRNTGAELVLRFRTAAPPYAARARGNVLEIVLGATPGARVARR